MPNEIKSMEDVADRPGSIPMSEDEIRYAREKLHKEYEKCAEELRQRNYQPPIE